MTPKQIIHTRKTLEALSKEEVITLFLEHQNRFQRVINQLEMVKNPYKQLIELFEAELNGNVELHIQNILSAAEPTEPLQLLRQEQDKEAAMRDALRHINDPAYLSRSALRMLVAEHTGNCNDGAKLQRAVRSVVQGLQCDNSVFAQWYTLLNLTYFEGIAMPDILKELGISKREYYRQQKRAIQTVVEQLLNT